MGTDLGLGVAELFILGAVVVLSGLFVIAVADALRQPREAWQAIGASRSTWVLLLFLFNWMAAAAYLLSVRPRLRRAVRSTTMRWPICEVPPHRGTVRSPVREVRSPKSTAGSCEVDPG